MKSLLTLLTVLLEELGQYSTIDTSRDIKTVTTRFEGEGLRFLTQTLPLYGRGLETALSRGKATPDLFPGFRSRLNLPIFLGGFMELIFDRTSGTVLDQPSSEAIRSVRQLTLLYKKIEIECSPEVTQAAYDAYIKSDSEVGEWEKYVPLDVLLRFHRTASLLYSTVFTVTDREIRDEKIVPRHGPGATADRLVANHKFEQPEWTERLDAVFPYWRYSTTSGYTSAEYDRVDFRDPGRERPVKVVHVPKTLEAPRIIAEEPTCMQYVQQGIAGSLKKAVDNSYLVDLIGTTHQEPNQLLALEGSLNGELATLDLSEASDRVSNLLVMTMMANFPHLNDGVQACRSLTAEVPKHGVVPLNRFASMGSALTFPVESMVFLTVVIIGMENAYRRHFTSRSEISRLAGSVRIYGDDIVVPVDVVDHVILALELYGFKVNRHKSFWTGKFRESCGKEYYAGDDVTICRVRRELPSSRDHVSEMISAVDFRNNAYWRGLWKTARWMDDYLSGLIPFPVVSDTSRVLGRHSVLGIPEYELDPKLHHPVVKGMVVRYRRRFSPIDDRAALMKCLGTFLQDDPITGRPLPQSPYGPWDQVGTDVDHLSYAGRPEAAVLNFRKARA